MIAIEAGLALYNRGIYAQSGDLAEAVRCLRLADAATKTSTTPRPCGLSASRAP